MQKIAWDITWDNLGVEHLQRQQDRGRNPSGFYHDGRFATLLDVVNHYNTQFNLQLSDTDKKDLIEYLKGI